MLSVILWIAVPTAIAVGVIRAFPNSKTIKNIRRWWGS